MSEKVVNIAFEILSSYPNANWEELCLFLFERAYEEGNKEIATQAFYQIILEAIRTKNTWAIEKIISNKDYARALNDLNLHSFAQSAFKVIPQEVHKYNPQKYWKQEWEFEKSLKYQFREGGHHGLCACCHDFVLTCEEIQDFPLVNEESYIREKFCLALSQEKTHKRIFIIDYLLTGYAERNPNRSLLFELWIMAEKSGIHIDLFKFIEKLGDQILEKKYFKSFLTIVNFRHYEHDHMIDSAVELLLKRKNFDLAFYLNGKISSPYARLGSAVGAILNLSNEEVDESSSATFLRKIVNSVKHEEVEND